MKNLPPACERQGCWHRGQTGNPEAQREHEVPHRHDQTVGMQASPFNSTQSQFLKDPAQNNPVFASRSPLSLSFPDVASAGASSNYLYSSPSEANMGI